MTEWEARASVGGLVTGLFSGGFEGPGSGRFVDARGGGLALMDGDLFWN